MPTLVAVASAVCVRLVDDCRHGGLNPDGRIGAEMRDGRPGGARLIRADTEGQPAVRFISPTAHGVLDYLFAATTFALPRAFGWSRRSTAVMTGVSLFSLLYTAMTRNQLGLVQLLPMKAHLGLDTALDAFLAAAQFQLSEEESKVRATLLGLAAFGMLATLLTRTDDRQGESVG